MQILAGHVNWDMRSSCFYQVISETMTAQIVLEVQIALMTDLSADRSISLILEWGQGTSKKSRPYSAYTTLVDY